MIVLVFIVVFTVLLCFDLSATAAETPRRASNVSRQTGGSKNMSPAPRNSGFSGDNRGPRTSNSDQPQVNTYLSRNPERASFNSNKNKFDFDGKADNTEEAKNWKSGQIFNQKRKSQRNDPWWMRDEEKNNPRIKAPYTPWWSLGPPADMSGWKVADLRTEAEKRGLPHDGLKKTELLEQLTKLNALYSLTDDNFRDPLYTESPLATSPPPCYPVFYEGGEDKISALRNKILLVPPASTK